MERSIKKKYFPYFYFPALVVSPKSAQLVAKIITEVDL